MQPFGDSNEALKRAGVLAPLVEAMTRTPSALMALLLLASSLAALPATAADPSNGSEIFESSTVLSGETNETNETYECGGHAPLMPVCTTGTHVREGPSFELGLRAVNYEGVLENRLEYLYGSVVLRCEIDGALGTCEFIQNGAFAHAGTTVVHECQSENATTGLPGGSGGWACWFTD